MIAACGEGAPPPEGEPVECALDGAADFVSECLLQRQGDALLVYTPDGGFRRVGLAADGSVMALDGMEQPATAQLPDGRVEFSIGTDRYRISPQIAAEDVH